jgi:hypothetical protein
METLARLAAIGQERTIGGVTYRFRELAAFDFALIDDRIRAKRGDPIEAARQLARDAPESLARDILLEAYRDSRNAFQVTPAEEDAYLKTTEGLMFAFWLQINPYACIHDRASVKDFEGQFISQAVAGVLFSQLGAESVEAFVAAFQAKNPGTNREELLEFALRQEEAETRALIGAGLGLPTKNPSTPEKPGTQTSRSTGADGSLDSKSDTDGPTETSAG